MTMVWQAKQVLLMSIATVGLRVTAATILRWYGLVETTISQPA